MRLNTNSLQANSVRRTTEDGTEYLVAEDVTIGRAMYLDDGYVPSEEWDASVGDWEGVPLPVGHPVDATGTVISANNQAVLANAVVGHLRNPTENTPDGVNGDLWVDVGKAESLGPYAERVVEILENGEPLEVSSAYYSDDAPAGEYDGEYRTEAVENLRPDHVALVPDGLGTARCSLEDGCGITADSSGTAPGSELAANAATVHVPGTAGDDSNRPPSVALATASPETDRSTTRQMHTNHSESDRVRWTTSDDLTRYGIVTNSVDAEDDGEGDAALVAPYEKQDDGWQSVGEAKTVPGEALTKIDEFPSSPASNTDDADTDSDADTDGDDGESDAGSERISANIRSEAREPDYSGLVFQEQTEDDHLWWSVEDYLDAYLAQTDATYDGDPYSPVSSIPDDSREWIADHTLLGTADGETEANLMLFAVVGPDGQLYEEKLLDVLGRDGARELIPEAQRESARAVARDLLETEFGHNFSANATTDGDDLDSSEIAAGAGTSTDDSEGLLARIRSLVGGTSGAESADESCHCHDDADAAEEDDNSPADDSPMTIDNLSDDDYEQLAANSAWSEDELRTNDDTAEKVAETVDLDDGDGETADGETTDADADTDTAADAGADTATDADTDADTNANDGVDEDVLADINDRLDTLESENEDLRETVNEREETIQRLETEREDAILAGTDFDDVDEAIAANSDFSDDEIESMDREFKRKTARSVLPDRREQTGTDFGGLGSPKANMNDVHANSDDDEDAGSKHGGSFAAYTDTDD